MQQLIERALQCSVTRVWYKSSHYANIACVELEPGTRAVVKVLMPWYLKELGAEERREQIALMNESTLRYRTFLAQAGVPLAREYDCYSEPDAAMHVIAYAGESVDAFLGRLEPLEAEILLARLIQAVRGVVEGDGEIKAGLDLALSNFCRDGSGRIAYVDLFPALCRYRGKVLVHFPNPADPSVLMKEFERKFLPLGILRRFRFNVLTLGMRFEPILMRALQRALSPKFFRRVAAYFATLGDQIAAQGTRPELEAVIDGLTLRDTDTARELALSLVPEDKSRNEVLGRVFDLSSSFSAHGVPGPERLAALKELLHAYVR